MSWIEISSLVMAPIAAVVSWFASKKKHRAETDGVNIKNTERVLSISDNWIKKMEGEISRLGKRIIQLEEVLTAEIKIRKSLEEENGTLKKKVKNLELQEKKTQTEFIIKAKKEVT
jgi:predicted RNase H-like nuclease (RuvC/YqgF family)